jgi:hypothetical protein
MSGRPYDKHEKASNEAALLGDREAYLEALSRYCRVGREAALEIRRGAA